MRHKYSKNKRFSGTPGLFKSRGKAQGMPVNVLIIALVALIVLVIIVAIFTGKIRGIGTGLSDCVSKGGRCDVKCTDAETEVIGVSSCQDKTQKCCMSILEEKK